MDADFRWQDGERLIRFGRGALADAADLLGDGYAVLTTPRARAAAPEVVERAATVHDVPGGLVEKSLGATRTEELAVMCDTFRPLKLTSLARDLDDPSYAYSWYEEGAQLSTTG